SFEPTLDYIVVKAPRFAFEKFADADPRLTTTMKSVGEAMAIGRSFPEALQKALRSLERKEAVFTFPSDKSQINVPSLLDSMRIPTEYRLQQVQQAMWAGATIEQVHESTKIDPWYLYQLQLINNKAEELSQPGELTQEAIFSAKQLGFSDQQIAAIRGISQNEVRLLRQHLGVRPVYKTVDTCAAEFEAFTPYHYSTYELETEVAPRTKPAVIILGSGPNRIGQGIEFDYSCVHASFTLREAGYETVMVNCNPETVSTDYDTSDRLYFEPLTLEDVLEVIAAEEAAGPVLGVITQLGGQTPLGLAQGLKDAGVTILGTSPDSINLAEERGAFGRILEEQKLVAPEYGMASSLMEAQDIAARITYPVLVRPSYVLGGRGMEIVYDDQALAGFISRATEITPGHPVLVDRFLDNAIEIDVDALFDGEQLFLGGVMEHIEEAGIHSGDSACVLPAMTITPNQLVEIRQATEKIARGVDVRGLINIQYAIANNQLYVLEANPRASRTVPFVSKSTGIPLAKAAARISVGDSIAKLQEEGLLPTGDVKPKAISVKEVVLPWNRFRRPDGRGVDATLGPEMRSTGEVMGIAPTFGESYAKSQIAAFGALPKNGTVFISLNDKEKDAGINAARELQEMGFNLVATAGTAATFANHGIKTAVVRKHSEGTGPLGEKTIVEQMVAGQIDLVINTPVGRGTRQDGWVIRTTAVQRSIPCITTVAGFNAAVEGIKAIRSSELNVKPLQEWLVEIAN
ncbi:MAG: carbamoyl-phosphate synthase large subunit, partial [Actinomycetales bacterium]|nr:carbamoyl-phosphate synthase large subunit [Actinomycetales bacterium]